MDHVTRSTNRNEAGDGALLSARMTPDKRHIEYNRNCVDVLGRIASGEVDNQVVEGVYHSDAWLLYETVWPNGPPDGIQPTPYQYSILQEFWYNLESYDPVFPETNEPDPLGDISVSREFIRETATMCRDMLLDEDADQETKPFPDWVNFYAATVPKGSLLRTVDIIIKTWPKYKQWSARAAGVRGLPAPEWYPLASVSRDGIDLDGNLLERRDMVFIKEPEMLI